MQSEYWKHFAPIIEECCTGLFQDCGVPLTPMAEGGSMQISDKGAVAFIGFSGPDVRGYMILGASLGLLRRAYPLAGDGAPEEDLREWLKELSNQLLGRVKGRLFSRGLGFDVSCPTSMVGMELRGDSGEVMRFGGESAALLVEFDAEMKPGFVFRAESPTRITPVEGDLLLFE
jgi:CheY-specific phosphatase CheX